VGASIDSGHSKENQCPNSSSAVLPSRSTATAPPRPEPGSPLRQRRPPAHGWAFATKYFSTLFGRTGGAEGIDNDFAARSDENIGASIMGRHMFGPPPGAKTRKPGKAGGPEPALPSPGLRPHPRKEVSPPDGGRTSFTFVNDGLESALKQAFTAAKGKDVRLAGGAATVRQYLKAGLIDELHLVQVPLLMGQGERIFEDLGGRRESLRMRRVHAFQGGIAFAHREKGQIGNSPVASFGR